MAKVFLIFSLFSSLSFAAPLMKMQASDTPCPGEACVQKCEFGGEALIDYQGIEVKGDVAITTLFDSSALEDKALVRTLISVKTKGFNARAFFDETNVFDTKTWRLDKVYSHMKFAMGNGDRGIKKVEWSQTEFSWPENFVELPYAKLSAISARSAAELKENFPGFVKHLPDSEFGQNWMSELAEQNPTHYPERDMEGFSSEVLSPAFVSLYHLRFIPVNSELKYHLFANYDLGPFETTLNGEQTNKANVALFQGELAYGDFETQPGKPAKFYVNQATQEFEKIELYMQNEAQGVNATMLTSKGSCQTIQ